MESKMWDDPHVVKDGEVVILLIEENGSNRIKIRRPLQQCRR